MKHERGLCEATQDRILSSSVFAENIAGWAGEGGVEEEEEEEGGGGGMRGGSGEGYIPQKGVSNARRKHVRHRIDTPISPATVIFASLSRYAAAIFLGLQVYCCIRLCDGTCCMPGSTFECPDRCFCSFRLPRTAVCGQRNSCLGCPDAARTTSRLVGSLHVGCAVSRRGETGLRRP